MIRVLIVDDEKLVRQGIISQLPWEEFDMRVVGEAKNGEKALELLETQVVDLMLTDLAMPVMSGIELMRTVRKKYPDMYVIVLTLHQDFEYIQEALRLGAIDYIAKVELVQDRFHEILERIHARIREEERKKGGSSSGSGVQAGVEAGADIEAEAHADANAEASASAVAEELWAQLGWLHDDEQLAANLRKLRALRLSESELQRLRFKLAGEWNELCGLSGAERLTAPERAGSWEETEGWFRTAQKTLSRTLAAPNYSQEVQEAVTKAIQLIQEQLGGQLYAADIAKQVNMSRSYFSQCFRDLTGRTFNEYVRQARVDKAKEYLAHTNRPILWIAEKTGYLDGKYFSTVFREQTGMLPSAYRKRHHWEAEK